MGTPVPIFRLRARPLAGWLLALLLLIVPGYFLQRSVRASLRQLIADDLQTILDADVTALEIWIDQELRVVRWWASQPQLRQHAGALAATGRSEEAAREVLLASPAQMDLVRLLQPIDEQNSYLGFGLVDRRGMVLAASGDEGREMVGEQLTATGMAALAPAFEGSAVIFNPQRHGPVLAGRETAPVLLHLILGTPVRNEDGQVIAALIGLYDGEREFTDILSIARIGQSGDTYAFDETGLLLSESRFEDQLKELGMLPDTPEARSALNLQLRDPGRDMTRGFRPSEPIASLPLTRMVRAAVAGQNGVDVEGYRDYRGVEVVGAWRWLPEYGIGVATEVDRDEALAPLKPLRAWFSLLGGLLIVALAGVGLSTWRAQRLSRQVDEARQLGQYTLEYKIGEGGMGQVYRARHALLRRPTVIKTLRPDIADEEMLARFEREVQLTSQLTHPNTVEVYDYGRTPDGIFYYAMEYLPGITLTQLIEMEGAIPPGRVIHILKQVCTSLEEAHDLGLIHRDIKPLNIMLCRRGKRADVVKVLDFGLVKDIQAQDTQLTSLHQVRGTAAYMAPERLTDPGSVDQRSDLYSLGAVGFNLLTGEDVFPGDTSIDVAYHVVNTPADFPSSRVVTAIPEALDELIVHCLAKDPADRPANVSEMIDILDGIQDVDRWTQDDACAWWDAKREPVAELLAQREAGQPVTAGREAVAIDVGRRRRGSVPPQSER